MMRNIEKYRHFVKATALACSFPALMSFIASIVLDSFQFGPLVTEYLKNVPLASYLTSSVILIAYLICSAAALEDERKR